jgi:hypothetical protein
MRKVEISIPIRRMDILQTGVYGKAAVGLRVGGKVDRGRAVGARR